MLNITWMFIQISTVFVRIKYKILLGKLVAKCKFHFLLDLSLALERVLTGGAGSGVLSLFELRLLEEGALWVSLLSSTWSFWDPFVEPFWCRELPLVKPFGIAVANRLAIGGVSPARVFFDEGSGERRGGVWLCFRFLWYLLKGLAKLRFET